MRALLTSSNAFAPEQVIAGSKAVVKCFTRHVLMSLDGSPRWSSPLPNECEAAGGLTVGGL
jgi:hypothetical protein